MQIYIEDAIANTTIMDFVIIFLTQFSLRLKIKFFKLILASLFGCLFSILISFFTFYYGVLILLKICCGLIICIFMVEKFTLKSFLLYFVVFISFTFLLGGFSISVMFLFNVNTSSIQSLLNNPPIIFSVIYILLAVYIYFLVNAIKIFYKKQKVEQYITQVKIVCNSKVLKLTGYIDTGNFLTDKTSNKPIIIINKKTFFKIFNNINIVDVLSLKLDKLISGNYISCSTVNGEDKIFIFNPENVFIKNNNTFIEKDVLLGFSFKFKLKEQNFDVLLSPMCMCN